MPKLKTHKGVAGRIKVTGTGKLTRFRSGRRHLLTRRPPKRMRQLRRSVEVSAAQEKKLRQLIPYS
ncbi:MAG: 50S ribosomal protein L35 [Candidatus Omnitrophica bacterium]|nr:50S ribosomal protein L35 [Candidatus Omnitrophota bacterium]